MKETVEHQSSKTPTQAEGRLSEPVPIRPVAEQRSPIFSKSFNAKAEDEEMPRILADARFIGAEKNATVRRAESPHISFAGSVKKEDNSSAKVIKSLILVSIVYATF